MTEYINKIVCGDCLSVMKGMPDNSIDSIVTDPPYGLKFMGKAWDHGVPGVEFWEEALRVCKPGAHMLAFGGTRTHHRLMVAIEDAGWEIRDCLGWIHGQGFPKGQDVAWEMHKRACNVAGNMVVIDHEEKTRLDIDKQLSETQHKMRFVRATYLQTPVYACAECGQVLQPLMSEQEAQELRSSWSKSETIWPEQPRMEGGNNLETPEGELQGCEICKMSHRILADGSEGWIHHGASACNGTIPWQTPNKDGSRPSYRPQSITQYDKQPLSFLLERTAQTHRGYNVNLKPAWEPIVLARKPMIDPSIDIVQAIEYNIKKNGFQGDIRWTQKSVKHAERQSLSKSFIETKQPTSAEAISAEHVRTNEMPNIEKGTKNLSHKKHVNGTGITKKEALSNEESLPRNLETKCLQPMEENAPVVAKPIKNFSPLTTLTGTEQSTEEKSDTLMFTEIYAEEVILKDSESCAGTATVPSADTDIVLTATFEGTEYIIEQLSDGSLVWPHDLPRSRPARQLTVAENVQKWGVGALDIDGCRVMTEEALQGSTVRNDIRGGAFAAGHRPNPGDIPQYTQNTQGRFPANIIHDGSEEVLAVFPESKGQQGDVSGKEPSRPLGKNAFGIMLDRQQFESRNDSGSAARFFYCAKASSSERGEGNTHPTVKPIDLIKYLIKLITPSDGLILDMFAGSGTTALAAIDLGFNYVLIEEDPKHVDIINQRLAMATRQERMFV